MKIWLSCRWILLAAASLALAGAGRAREPAIDQRPCKPEDLLGAWKVIKSIAYAPAVSRTNMYEGRYEWVLFAADGSGKILASQPDLEDDEIQRTLPQTPVSFVFEFERDGQFRIRRSDPALEKELWRGDVIVRGRTNALQRLLLQSGDLVMTQLGSSGQVLMIRQLRKIPQRKTGLENQKQLLY